MEINISTKEAKTFVYRTVDFAQQYPLLCSTTRLLAAFAASGNLFFISCFKVIDWTDHFEYLSSRTNVIQNVFHPFVCHWTFV